MYYVIMQLNTDLIFYQSYIHSNIQYTYLNIIIVGGGRCNRCIICKYVIDGYIY